MVNQIDLFRVSSIHKGSKMFFDKVLTVIAFAVSHQLVGCLDITAFSRPYLLVVVVEITTRCEDSHRVVGREVTLNSWNRVIRFVCRVIGLRHIVVDNDLFEKVCFVRLQQLRSVHFDDTDVEESGSVVDYLVREEDIETFGEFRFNRSKRYKNVI